MGWYVYINACWCVYINISPKIIYTCNNNFLLAVSALQTGNLANWLLIGSCQQVKENTTPTSISYRSCNASNENTRLRKCCTNPECQSVSISRRVRRGGWHCNKCGKNFTVPSQKTFKPPIIKKLNSLFTHGQGVTAWTVLKAPYISSVFACSASSALSPSVRGRSECPALMH